jgi:hypothetical protein
MFSLISLKVSVLRLTLNMPCPMFPLISSITPKVSVRRLTDHNSQQQQSHQQQPHKQPAAATPHKQPTTSSLRESVIYSGNKMEQQFSGWGVWHCNWRNLPSLLSESKHLSKSSLSAFCPCPLMQLGPCQPSLQIIWHSCAHSLLQLGPCQLSLQIIEHNLCFAYVRFS